MRRNVRIKRRKKVMQVGDVQTGRAAAADALVTRVRAQGGQDMPELRYSQTLQEHESQITSTFMCDKKRNTPSP